MWVLLWPVVFSYWPRKTRIQPALYVALLSMLLRDLNNTVLGVNIGIFDVQHKIVFTLSVAGNRGGNVLVVDRQNWYW